ncbi:MAG TPA: YfaZ family outer membrane protein [Motiliproteus sp.]
MMKIASIATLSAALFSGSALASNFNIGINNDTVDLGLYAPISNASRLSADYLYHDTDGDMLALGFQVTNRTNRGTMALGVKAVKLWSNIRSNGHAFALGGDFSMPVAPQASAAVSLYYAPSVLAASGLDRYFHFDARGIYALMPNADVYVGYRSVNFKFDNNRDQKLDQSLYLGASLKF